jgi:DNA-binding MarR family transcriptional regulator
VLMPPSLSRILKSLTEQGLIARVETEDARVRMVKITPAGREKYDAMAGRAARIYARLGERFGEERMELLLDLLVDLRRVAEKP